MGETDAPASRRKRLPIVLGAAAAAVLVAVAVVVVVSNGDDEKPAAKPTSSARPAPEPPPLDPLPLAGQPVWVSAGIDGVEGAEVRDGVALYWGESTASLLDLATGAVRWSTAKEPDLPGGDGAEYFPLYGRPRLVGHGAGLGVLAGYYWTDGQSTEVGLALLPVATGTVRWRVPILTPAEVGRASYRIGAADDQTALVTVTGDSERSELEDLRVLALDLATGAERWRGTGFWPVEIAGDTVVGAVATTRPRAYPADQLPEGDVAGFDLATGARRWSLAERHARSQSVLTAGDLLLVRVARKDGTGQAGMLVETATGREVTKFGDKAESCAGGETLIACEVNLEGGFGVATFRLDGRKAEVSAAKLNRFSVEAVWQDRIFVSNTGEWFTIDRAANRVDENLAGKLVGWTDGYALFMVRNSLGATVHCFPLSR